jgi:hypothetical protein
MKSPTTSRCAQSVWAFNHGRDRQISAEQRLMAGHVCSTRRKHHPSEADLCDDERAEEARLAAAVKRAARQRWPSANATPRRADGDDLPVRCRVHVSAHIVVALANQLSFSTNHHGAKRRLVPGDGDFSLLSERAP